MARSTSKKSEYALAREIARRLERAGAQAYAGDNEQYLVLEGDRQGEIIEFGRPLRDHRLLPVKSKAKIKRLAEQFAAFADVEDQADWCLWTVCRPARKTKTNEIEEDYRRFNDDLNVVLSDLRKRCGLKLLLLGIHIRFDAVTGLFDLHAHFVCSIARDQRETARRRLLTAFSRCHLPDSPIRSPHGVARYIAKTFKLTEVVRWPKRTLLAAWKLGGKKFHYCRTAGRFAAYRRDHRPVVDPHQREVACRMRANRKETRHCDGLLQDRRLVRRTWRFGDQEVSGTLYQRALSDPAKRPSAVHPQHPAVAGPTTAYYPSTDMATTQAPPTAGSILSHQAAPSMTTTTPQLTISAGVTAALPSAVQPSPPTAGRTCVGLSRFGRIGRLLVGSLKRILARALQIFRKNE